MRERASELVETTRTRADPLEVFTACKPYIVERVEAVPDPKPACTPTRPSASGARLNAPSMRWFMGYASAAWLRLPSGTRSFALPSFRPSRCAR